MEESGTFDHYGSKKTTTTGPCIHISGQIRGFSIGCMLKWHRPGSALPRCYQSAYPSSMAPLSTAWLIFTVLPFHIQYSPEMSSPRQKILRREHACARLCELYLLLLLTRALEPQSTTNSQKHRWQAHLKEAVAEKGDQQIKDHSCSDRNVVPDRRSLSACALSRKTM